MQGRSLYCGVAKTHQTCQLLQGPAHVIIIVLVAPQLGQVPVAALYHLQQFSGIFANLGSLHGGERQRQTCTHWKPEMLAASCTLTPRSYIQPRA
jgi:hypothetical protein